MAVSNPPTLSSVKATFGGPGNLAAYVRGGAYVPDIATNAAIATVATSLKLSQFAGAENIAFTLPAECQTTAPKAGLGTNASLTLSSTGAYSGTHTGNWVTPTSQASGLDVFVTKTGTDPVSGTLNAWVAMSTSRTWSMFADAGESWATTLTFQFRKTGTTTVLGSDSVIMSADAL